MNVLSGIIAIFVLTECKTVSSLSLNVTLNPIEDVIGVAVETVAKEVVDQVRVVVKLATIVNQKVNDNSLLGKLRDRTFELEKGIVSRAASVVSIPVDLRNIAFYLVTASNLANPKKIDFFKPEDVARTSGKIIFLIHGWLTTINVSWYHDLSKVFIRKYPDTYIVLLEWDFLAFDRYIFSAFHTERIGEYVGLLINRLVGNYNVSFRNIILIGHSLGAHIAGFASKTFTRTSQRKLPRIVALDPAAPLFIFRPSTKRLDKNDADVVMVIHTDAGAKGYPTAIGKIDFFSNGGFDQPGCWRTLKVFHLLTYLPFVKCSHEFSSKYFVEAVNVTGSFPARKCDSYENFKKGKCDESEIVTMGDMDTAATCTSFLKTNSKKPFSRPLLQGENKNGNQ